MNFNYRELLPGEMDGSSRVWIYQSSRVFNISEVFQIEERLGEFVGSWKSHGSPVKGYGKLFFGQFVILMADETASGISGCSTDSSMRLIRELENQFSVQLLNRQILAFLINDKIQLWPLSQLPFVAAKGNIKPDTLYFNNTIATKSELENDWIIPIKNSWLSSRISFPDSVLK